MWFSRVEYNCDWFQLWLLVGGDYLECVSRAEEEEEEEDLNSIFIKNRDSLFYLTL